MNTVMVNDWEWVEDWLDIWRADMINPDLRNGAPQKASGCTSISTGGYRDISEEWTLEVNRRAVNLINATLEDMTPVERCSVHHKKLYAIFRFQEPAEEVYERARMKIGIRLRAADFQ